VTDERGAIHTCRRLTDVTCCGSGGGGQMSIDDL